jgi:hypothetical protein
MKNRFKRVTACFLLGVILSCGNLWGQTRTEKYAVFEWSQKGPSSGNPFVDVTLSGVFVKGADTVIVRGFYDGEGVYKIRFMPKQEGRWTFATRSNVSTLNGKKGALVCLPPGKNNHGPVGVKDTLYFAYADGKPYYPFGTTCYAWAHQGDSLAKVTLQTLSKGYFNKMRMCIFPKSYDWNTNEPAYYPFEGRPLKNWNYSRFNPLFFRNMERRIQQLDSLGIEADLIVFHPYDRWGFSAMDRATDDRYIEYVIARFGAYKNVWWSMANEYDFMNAKTMNDWDHYIDKFGKEDPFHHLISIHNAVKFYNHKNPLISHVSVQGEDTYKAKDYLREYKKPVIFDECRYEGNIPWSWGNLTGQTMVEKCWRGVTNGGYVGHGETYVTENPIRMPSQSSDILWWSKGGDLKGESPERIRFLREILEAAPPKLKSLPLFTWMPFSCIGIENEYYLGYLNDAQPRSIVIDLPKQSAFKVEIIDTWNRTITPVKGLFSGHCLIELPQKPYQAVRITRNVPN